jgi:protein associated with RNAse G/E
LYIDNHLNDEIVDLFDEKPTVYSYDTDLDIISFSDIELKKLDTYEVCFEYNINKYKKAQDMIVETKGKVYMFNSFYDKAIEFEYLSDIREYFDEIQEELRDAL